MGGKALAQWACRCGLGLSLSLSGGTAQAMSLTQLQSCMRENLPPSSFVQNLSLMSEDTAGGQQVLSGRLFGLRLASGAIDMMLSIDEPAGLEGARYLLVTSHGPEDMYVYLPAMDRVRRIIGAKRGQPLWGTDFSYEDIKQLHSVRSDSDIEWLGEQALDGRQAYAMALTPKPGAQSSYSRIELTVDGQTCLPLEVRFFDEAGLLKRMRSRVEDFHQIDGHWTIGSVSMRNVRQSTRSVLNLHKVRYSEGLSRELFDPETFYRSR